MVYVYKPELKENLEDVVNRLSPIIAAYRNSMEDNKVQVDVVKNNLLKVLSDKDKIGYCWRPKLMGRLKKK